MEQTGIRLSHPSKEVREVIQLTGSKSESNRALIIRALNPEQVSIHNLSEAADTVTLAAALERIATLQHRGDFSSNSAPQNTEKTEASAQNLQVIDIGPAGTAMRFLTAYTPLHRGEFLLTGSERMKQRPIGILSDAMTALGANISFDGNTGYPPLHIVGPLTQKTNKVSIQGNVSSQYISALLLIASSLPEGLELTIEGELTSVPYVEMTLNMLEEAGIQHQWTDNQITILPQQAKISTLSIEPDWSAASYWYSILALAEKGDLLLPELRASSLQGDQAIKDIMLDFGVLSVFTDDGLKLTKIESQNVKDCYDFIKCPDLAQTVIVCCAALNHEISFTGLETLKIKETDRIAALQNELAKFGVRLFEEEPGKYRLDCSKKHNPDQVTFSTYEDHRMAMAFAPLALVMNDVVIEEPNVVEKSYPLFWKHLQKVGFKID